MLTVADIGKGGVKNHWKSANVLCGWSLIGLRMSYADPRSKRGFKTKAKNNQFHKYPVINT